MAVLPTPTPQNATSLGEPPVPRPIAEAPAIDTGAVPRAVGGIGDALLQIDDELTKARRASQLTNAVAGASADLGQKGLELSRDQDFATVPQRFKDYANEVGQKYASGINDGVARQLFLNDFQKLAVAHQLSVVKGAYAQEADYNAARLQESTDLYAQQAVDAASSGNLTLRDQLIKQAQQGIDTMAGRFGGPGWITDVHAKALQDRFFTGYYDAWRLKDPAAALGDFQASRPTMNPVLAMRLEQHLFQTATPALAEMLLDAQAQKAVSEIPKPSGVLSGGYKSVAQIMASAVEGVESGGNAGAISTKGALGAMQLMPDTAREVAGQMGLEYDESRLLTDKGYNRSLGTQYLSNMLERYSGNQTLALAAYNAGPGRVDQWISQYGDPRSGTVTSQQFADQIPFKETRDYVQKLAPTMDDAAGSPGSKLTTRIASLDPRQPLGIPVIDNLPLDQKMHVMQYAQALSDRQNRGALQDLEQRVSNAKAESISTGSVTNRPSDAEILATAGPVKGPSIIRDLQDSLALGQNLQSIQSLPTSDISALVDRSTPQPGSPDFAQLQHNHEVLAQAANSVISMRNADPMAYALSSKSYGVAPLNFADIKAVTSEMTARAAAASNISRDYQTPLTLFTKGEAGALSKAMRDMPVIQQEQYLGAIYQGLSQGRSFADATILMQGAMKQVVPHSPVTALAGVYAGRYANTGTPTADVPGLLLRGEAILNPPKNPAGQEGGKFEFPMPADKDLRNDWDSTTGQAFQGREQAVGLYYPAAKAIYAAMSSDAGDFKGVIDSSRWRDAIKLATGGLEKYNGTATLMPYQWSADSFKTELARRIDMLDPKALPKGVTTEQLKDLPVQASRDGEYFFRSGTGYLTNPVTKQPLAVSLTMPQAYVAPAPAPRPPAELGATRRGKLGHFEATQ